MAAPQKPAGPHQAIDINSDQELLLGKMFDALWHEYRRRVEYVQTYETLMQQAQASFVNDHVAFRTLAGQSPLTGIATLSRVFEALGYRPEGCYSFPDKNLTAIHFQHANPNLPKLFISQLELWRLSAASREILESSLATHRPPVSSQLLTRLGGLSDRTLTGVSSEPLLEELLPEFLTLPWKLPEAEAVTRLDQETQYGAWVLVHGYQVNHFTSLVNSHQHQDLDSLEKTVQALEKAGVPMKSSIEGEPGSKLRQTATRAAVTDVACLRNGTADQMEWTYAYLEFAERGTIADPETGRRQRFEGFLGPQATNLFEMTKKNEPESG